MISNIELTELSSETTFMSDFPIKSVEMTDPTKPDEGNATILFSGKHEGYKMKVNMKKGKKEGKGVIYRKNNTVFMELFFVNDITEGELIERDRFGHVIRKGCLHEGRKSGLFTEFDDKGIELNRCFYRNGLLISELKKSKQINGFIDEVDVNGIILSTSQYSVDRAHKEGICYEYENGVCSKKYQYKNDERVLLMSEFKEDIMIEYDDKGKRVYEGGYGLDKTKGYVRNGEGSEYMSDGVSALYVGHFDNGMRSGEGTLYRNGYPQYIGEWKNGLKNGKGHEYDKNGNVVRQGEWKNGIRNGECTLGLAMRYLSYLFVIVELIIGVVCTFNSNFSSVGLYVILVYVMVMIIAAIVYCSRNKKTLPKQPMK